MTFQVVGQSASDGRQVTLLIEAETSESAIRRAKRRGLSKVISVDLVVAKPHAQSSESEPGSVVLSRLTLAAIIVGSFLVGGIVVGMPVWAIMRRDREPPLADTPPIVANAASIAAPAPDAAPQDATDSGRLSSESPAPESQTPDESEVIPPTVMPQEVSPAVETQQPVPEPIPAEAPRLVGEPDAPRPEKPAPRPAGFTFEQWRWFEAGRTLMILNNVYTAPAAISPEIAALTKQAKADPARDPSARLARLLLVKDALTRQLDAEGRDSKRIVEGLPGVYYSLALSALFDGVSQAEVRSLDSFRRGPGAIAEDWLFEARDALTARAIVKAQLYESISELSRCVGDISRVGLPDTPIDPLHLKIEKIEKVELRRIKDKPPAWQNRTYFDKKKQREVPLPHLWATGALLRYTGEEPLHHVIVVVRRESSGRDITLTTGQLQVMGFNENTGYGDHNSSIANYFRAQNLLSSMPNTQYGCVAVLNKGDVLEVVTDDVCGTDCYRGTFVSVFADEGRMLDVRVDPPVQSASPRPTRKSR